MGIRHLCDEKIKDDEFDSFLLNLEKFSVTEKVDGTNLTFGLDASGEFYINRDKKDGRKYGNIYPNNKYLLGTVFSKYFDVLFSFAQTGAITMSRDSAFEIEIIDDEITNVVPYDARQIIILDKNGTIEIYKDSIESPLNSGIYWNIKENSQFTIDCDAVRQLFKDSDRSSALTEMKKMLLDVPSQYGENNPDSWIEGLVFKSEDRIYKLVNKDRFTIMNKFLHKFRNKMSAPKMGENHTGGLFQEMIFEIAAYYGVPKIGTAQKKRWIASNLDWSDGVILRDVSCYSTNAIAIGNIITKYQDLFKEAVEEYNSTFNTDFIETPYGKCYIDEYTHNRNFACIADVGSRIEQVKASITDNSHTKLIGIYILS